MLTVAALYQFKDLPDFLTLKPLLHNFCDQHKIKGSLLLAPEGINGTVCGAQNAITELKQYLISLGFDNLEYKESFSRVMPFFRLKIKLKKEICTLQVEDLNPGVCKGEYVSPKDWNALISRDDVILIDTRNDYEIEIGTFKGAIDPSTKIFTQFKQYAIENLEEFKTKKMAMFCTGGIRCEKSTAYMKYLGLNEVYHLKGGILQYLEEIPESESMWIGECFVFDQRVSVTHGLKLGTHEICHGCRMPVGLEAKKSQHYQEGVCCTKCFDKYNPAHYHRMAERQKQVVLARQKGLPHMGAYLDVRKAASQTQKQAHKQTQKQTEQVG